MTLIECPNCHCEVDVDLDYVEKNVNGPDLMVRCPKCGAGFVCARIVDTKKKLKVAQYGYKINHLGKKERIKL